MWHGLGLGSGWGEHSAHRREYSQECVMYHCPKWAPEVVVSGEEESSLKASVHLFLFAALSNIPPESHGPRQLSRLQAEMKADNSEM